MFGRRVLLLAVVCAVICSAESSSRAESSEEDTPPVEEDTPPVEEDTPPVEEDTPPVEEVALPVEEPEEMKYATPLYFDGQILLRSSMSGFNLGCDEMQCFFSSEDDAWGADTLIIKGPDSTPGLTIKPHSEALRYGAEFCLMKVVDPVASGTDNVRATYVEAYFDAAKGQMLRAGTQICNTWFAIFPTIAEVKKGAKYGSVIEIDSRACCDSIASYVSLHVVALKKANGWERVPMGRLYDLTSAVAMKDQATRSDPQLLHFPPLSVALHGMYKNYLSWPSETYQWHRSPEISSVMAVINKGAVSMDMAYGLGTSEMSMYRYLVRISTPFAAASVDDIKATEDPSKPALHLSVSAALAGWTYKFNEETGAYDMVAPESITDHTQYLKTTFWQARLEAVPTKRSPFNLIKKDVSELNSNFSDLEEDSNADAGPEKLEAAFYEDGIFDLGANTEGVFKLTADAVQYGARAFVHEEEFATLARMSISKEEEVEEGMTSEEERELKRFDVYMYHRMERMHPVIVRMSETAAGSDVVNYEMTKEAEMLGYTFSGEYIQPPLKKLEHLFSRDPVLPLFHYGSVDEYDDEEMSELDIRRVWHDLPLIDKSGIKYLERAHYWVLGGEIALSRLEYPVSHTLFHATMFQQLMTRRRTYKVICVSSFGAILHTALELDQDGYGTLDTSSCSQDAIYYLDNIHIYKEKPSEKHGSLEVSKSGDEIMLGGTVDADWLDQVAPVMHTLIPMPSVRMTITVLYKKNIQDTWLPRRIDFGGVQSQHVNDWFKNGNLHSGVGTRGGTVCFDGVVYYADNASDENSPELHAISPWVSRAYVIDRRLKKDSEEEPPQTGDIMLTGKVDLSGEDLSFKMIPIGRLSADFAPQFPVHFEQYCKPKNDVCLLDETSEAPALDSPLGISPTTGVASTQLTVTEPSGTVTSVTVGGSSCIGAQVSGTPTQFKCTVPALPSKSVTIGPVTMPVMATTSSGETEVGSFTYVECRKRDMCLFTIQPSGVIEVFNIGRGEVDLTGIHFEADPRARVLSASLDGLQTDYWVWPTNSPVSNEHPSFGQQHLHADQESGIIEVTASMCATEFLQTLVVFNKLRQIGPVVGTCGAGRTDLHLTKEAEGMGWKKSTRGEGIAFTFVLTPPKLFMEASFNLLASDSAEELTEEALDKSEQRKDDIQSEFLNSERATPTINEVSWPVMAASTMEAAPSTYMLFQAPTRPGPYSLEMKECEFRTRSCLTSAETTKDLAEAEHANVEQCHVDGVEADRACSVLLEAASKEFEIESPKERKDTMAANVKEWRAKQQEAGDLHDDIHMTIFGEKERADKLWLDKLQELHKEVAEAKSAIAGNDYLISQCQKRVADVPKRATPPDTTPQFHKFRALKQKLAEMLQAVKKADLAAVKSADRDIMTQQKIDLAGFPGKVDIAMQDAEHTRGPLNFHGKDLQGLMDELHNLYDRVTGLHHDVVTEITRITQGGQ